MQEAKPECRGTWYLPAGRMEPGETIVEAMQREVEEETGLQCQPLTLLAVEERGASWLRFVFLARPTGACGGGGLRCLWGEAGWRGAPSGRAQALSLA